MNYNIYGDPQRTISAYQPDLDIVKFTQQVKRDYDEGVKILNRPWLELNNRSVIEDENRGQLMFNAFVDTSTEDPSTAWQWRGTRSMARNKGIAMHAQLTANYLLPLFVAQNDKDEVDLDFSEVMRDLVEWMASPINSDYQSSFLQVVFGMETNPVTFLGAEFFEIYQEIKYKTEEGYTTQRIIDEVLSGFQAPIYSSSQILITNAYERNIQKQRRIIKRRYAEKQELEAKWGDHPHWPYVQSGILSIYNEEDGLFYDIKDQDHPYLVAEESALSRRDDSEVTFINGIYFGNVDSIENNPIRHRDNRGAPKYNATPFGYHRIGEHFFYYKSMMNAVGWDNMLYDAMSEVVMNNAFLEQDPPVFISGTDDIDSAMNFPKAVVATENKDARAVPIFPPKNFAAGFNALRETEKSISEGTINETMMGQLPEASQKAYSVAQAQVNAKKIVGGVVKSLAQSMIQFGDLMKDIVINNITIPQVDELVGGGLKLKYKAFLVENKNIQGKLVSKQIRFDEGLLGSKMSKERQDERNLKLLSEVGWPDNKKHLYLVNPEMFAKFKYLVKVDVEEMFTKNAEFLQPILTNLYGMLANDPFVEREALLRKLLYTYFQSDADNLIRKQPIPGTMPTGPDMFGQMGQNKQLATAVGGMV